MNQLKWDIMVRDRCRQADKRIACLTAAINAIDARVAEIGESADANAVLYVENAAKTKKMLETEKLIYTNSLAACETRLYSLLTADQKAVVDALCTCHCCVPVVTALVSGGVCPLQFSTQVDALCATLDTVNHHEIVKLKLKLLCDICDPPLPKFVPPTPDPAP